MTADDLGLWQPHNATDVALNAISEQLARVADALEGMQPAPVSAPPPNAPSDGSVAVCEGSRPGASAYPDGRVTLLGLAEALGVEVEEVEAAMIGEGD